MKSSALWNLIVILVCGTVLVVYASQRWQSVPRMTPLPDAGDRVGGASALGIRNAAKTVILLTSSGCHFCTESMEFYRRLLETVKPGGVRVVGITWEAPEVNASYLAAHGVTPDAVIPAANTTIASRATPALILVDARGTVIKSWAGRLDQAAEAEVLRSARN